MNLLGVTFFFGKLNILDIHIFLISKQNYCIKFEKKNKSLKIQFYELTSVLSFKK